MMVTKYMQHTRFKSTSILPLVMFRIAFGFLMCFSMFRFMYMGWIEDAYTHPTFHFTYHFFDWVTPFSTNTMYAIVTLCGLSALCIGIGFLYRISTLLFFISFTYLELIEKSWYLNHYYFVSLVAFLLLLVPANRYFAVDTKLFQKIKTHTVPAWTLLIFKLQLSVVYFYGGIAKLKSDWLLDAQPLTIWLKARTDLPLLGWLFEYDLTAYVFSWSGMLYDISIPFLLFYKKSRPLAYLLVVVFHVLTHALFHIGMFPWLMIFGSLVFLSHQEWIQIFSFFKLQLPEFTTRTSQKIPKTLLLFLYLFFGFQFIFPLRHHVLSNNVLWTEHGLRFSWHVMISEKNGFTEFEIIDKNSSKIWIDSPSLNLSTIQEKQFSFQPDMIWQYAQYLKKEYHNKGYPNIEIYAHSKVALNGRASQPFINPKQDLLKVTHINHIYKHVLPLRE